MMVAKKKRPQGDVNGTPGGGRNPTRMGRRMSDLSRWVAFARADAIQWRPSRARKPAMNVVGFEAYKNSRINDRHVDY
jgi:hypothetical protein